MNKTPLLNPAIALAALLLAPLCANAADGKDTLPDPEQASIPFVDHGGIRDWHADRDRGLWVQDNRRNWYYAKLLGPCTGLDFATAIGFVTKPPGSFDRFSTIIVPREGSCPVVSFVRSDGPPPKEKRAANATDDATAH
ncbi:MAG: hypothetical protein KF790_08265 [Steroidobacteraceae bacterium]|nr:hypothetical protein [Steroidobacteraceae bacterium]MCW5573034.1 hypothetical protein [Steroidobacteraceae bacterium]